MGDCSSLRGLGDAKLPPTRESDISGFQAALGGQ